MIIAIDGPAGTGKSTLAQRLAEKIGFFYCDTGAMYRCLTYALLKHQINFTHQKELVSFLSNYTCTIEVREKEKRYFFEGEDITTQIRQERVTSLVSQISSIPEIREKLVALQRELGSQKNAVFEGRDIGTVVFPHAELKIFLTARPEVRAHRRYLELQAKFPDASQHLSLETLLAQVQERDMRDMNRIHSPLFPAKDAYLLDVSDLSIEEALAAIMEKVTPLIGHFS